jgi:hypothetical protein
MATRRKTPPRPANSSQGPTINSAQPPVEFDETLQGNLIPQATVQSLSSNATSPTTTTPDGNHGKKKGILENLKGIKILTDKKECLARNKTRWRSLRLTIQFI